MVCKRVDFRTCSVCSRLTWPRKYFQSRSWAALLISLIFGDLSIEDGFSPAEPGKRLWNDLMLKERKKIIILFNFQLCEGKNPTILVVHFCPNFSMKYRLSVTFSRDFFSPFQFSLEIVLNCCWGLSWEKHENCKQIQCLVQQSVTRFLWIFWLSYFFYLLKKYKFKECIYLAFDIDRRKLISNKLKKICSFAIKACGKFDFFQSLTFLSVNKK